MKYQKHFLFVVTLSGLLAVALIVWRVIDNRRLTPERIGKTLDAEMRGANLNSAWHNEIVAETAAPNTNNRPKTEITVWGLTLAFPADDARYSVFSSGPPVGPVAVSVQSGEVVHDYLVDMGVARFFGPADSADVYSGGSQLSVGSGIVRLGPTSPKQVSIADPHRQLSLFATFPRTTLHVTPSRVTYRSRVTDPVDGALSRLGTALRGTGIRNVEIARASEEARRELMNETDQNVFLAMHRADATTMKSGHSCSLAFCSASLLLARSQLVTLGQGWHRLVLDHGGIVFFAPRAGYVTSSVWEFTVFDLSGLQVCDGILKFESADVQSSGPLITAMFRRLR